MKISKSKQELARIISENGGWRDGAKWAAQCKSDVTVSFYSGCEPYRDGDRWRGEHLDGTEIKILNLMPNWHRTILSREEYFHLYQESDAKHEFCESVIRSIQEPETKKTIEQLASDYRNAKDYAARKQQEADAAKADADARLKALELACEELGLIVSPITAKQEPELAITDWRDLKVGDEVEAVVPNGGEVTTGEHGIIVEIDVDGFWSNFPSQKQYWYCGMMFESGDVKFIRRP